MAIRTALVFTLGVFIAGMCSHAQVTTATIYGSVTDPSGATVPGATVNLTQQETGSVTSKTTNQNGDVQFDFLRVGTYTLSIEATGFKRYQAAGIQLSSGQSLRQTFPLEVGQATESVQVEAAAPLVNLVSAEQNQSYSAKTVTDLPLARRNFSGILGIGTGVSVAAGGSSEGWRMNGVGRSGTAFAVDGTDANANPEGRGAQNFAGVNYVDVLSLESIAEVSTVKGVLPAEYGGALGGQVNVLTKSGTGQFHGSLFENFQAENLTAKDPFVIGNNPPFTYNQYGASVGGPLIKDKVFFFGAYEGYQEARMRRIEATVPTQFLREQMIRAVPTYADILNTMPLPNQPVTATATAGLFSAPGVDRRSDNHVDVKGDIRLTNNSNLALTYTRGRPFRRNAGVQSFVSADFDTLLNVYADRSTASYVTGGARWSSETRFGYNRNDTDQVVNTINLKDPRNPDELFGYGRRVGRISTNLGWNAPASEKVLIEGPTWTLGEKFALTQGSHSLKFGGQFAHHCCRRENPEAVAWTYNGLPDLLANIPSNISVSYGQGEYKATVWELGLFIQDDWRIHPKLTLNLGFRYDWFNHMVASPLNNSGSIMVNPDGIRDQNFTVGPLRPANNAYESDKLNTGPRFGFSYDTTGKGKTVIRGGTGVIFSPQVLANLWGGVQAPLVPRRAIFSRQEAITSNLKYPMTNDDFRPIVARQIQDNGVLPVYSIINPNLQNPYTIHLTMGVQHQLANNYVLETSFVGVLGRKFLLSRVPNQPDRVTGVRPNPKLLASYYIDESQTSHYYSWQTSLRKRFSSRFSGSAHYTWGKTIATNGGDTGAWYQGDNNTRQQDYFNIRAEKGPAVGDLNHVLAAELVYDTPALMGMNKAVKSVLGNWQVGSVFSARSGEPLGITQASSLAHQRPDYVGGNTVNGNWEEIPTLQYLNRSAFALLPLIPASGAAARPGTLGWGAVRGPGAWNLDVSLGKNIAITEKVRLQIRTDTFNTPNKVFYTGINTAANNPLFGQARATRGLRVVQFNVRLSF